MTLRNSRELRILVFLQNLKWPGTSSQVCASGVGALHKEIVSQTQSHLPSRRGRQNTGSRERLQRRKPFRSRSQCSALARRARGTMIVLDASAAVDCLLRTPAGALRTESIRTTRPCILLTCWISRSLTCFGVWCSKELFSATVLTRRSRFSGSPD